VVAIAAILGLAVTAGVQASQRRHANKVVASTRRDLTATQQQLDQSRSDAKKAQADLWAARSEANDAEAELVAAKNAFEPELASEAASNLDVTNDEANCIAQDMLKRLSLADLLQTDTTPDFMKAVFLAEAQCITAPPAA
jgi:outer membrane murein-binding lipoprotein Lpp